MRLMGFECKELVVYVFQPCGQSFQMTFMVGIYRIYSISHVSLSADDCEIACFGIPHPRVLKEKFARSPSLKGQIISVQQRVKKSAGSKSSTAIHSPLLFPSGPLRMVHSSMLPKDSKRRRTSSSDCCLLSMPTKSFLSSKRKGRRLQSEDQRCLLMNTLKEKQHSIKESALVKKNLLKSQRLRYST